MHISTYNVASVRARLPLLLQWLEEEEPDVVALQETKVEDEKFPIGDFEDLGYHVALNGIKSWNGTAILSKEPISNVRKGFQDPLFPEDGRILSGQTFGIEIINTYVPNGNTVGSDKWDYKLRWLERFGRMFWERYQPSQKLIWLGDVNIAPQPEDVYDSPRFLGGVGHHPDEFIRLDKIRAFGLQDTFRLFTEGPGHYTYWDFYIKTDFGRNNGWRIDHIYATEGLAATCTECSISRQWREMSLKPSDHTIVTANFEI